ncbi:MAG: DUF1801 domain-containing protein [Acholeplasmataceae bacterium]|nr:DUF1801 domain-containing protein [Acholeplasmataceae bacterium]
MKTKKLNLSTLSNMDQVDMYMENLDHPLKEGVQVLREIILSSNEELIEGIKWDAPSYAYGDEERITMNLHRKDMIQLVFHCGAQKRVHASDEPLIQDASGLLSWASVDRAIIKFKKTDEITGKINHLVGIIKAWLNIPL